MLFDFNEAWPRVAEAQYDVCICGAGPAGITTARKLAARGKRGLLLEGGGLTYSDTSEDLYKGRSVGRRYYYLDRDISLQANSPDEFRVSRHSPLDRFRNEQRSH